MSYQKYLEEQLKLHLPDSVAESVEMRAFLNTVHEGYRSLERDLHSTKAALLIARNKVDTLTANLAFCQSALEGSGKNTWEYSIDDDIYWFSSEFAQAMGFGNEQLSMSRLDWQRLLHPEDLSSLIKRDEDYESGHTVNHLLIYRLIDKEGEYRWILDRGTALEPYRSDKKMKLSGMQMDVTNKKPTELKVKDNEEVYQDILANMNLGLVEIDNNDHIRYANETFCQMSGYGLSELLNKKPTDVFTLSEQNQSLVNEKISHLKQGVSEIYEVEVSHKNDGKRWWLVSATPKINEEGKPVGAIGIHLDITARKQLEGDLIFAKEEAIASRMAKDMFLANMSHEIRTPMSVILGMSSQIQKTKLNKEQQIFIQAISAAANSLLVVVNDILDLSKIDAGKMGLENIGFESKSILKRLMELMGPWAAEKGLRMTISFFDPKIAGVLVGDPYRINQVLLNLVSNAIKFTPQGSVELRCDLVKEQNGVQQLRFTVSDTGIGMEDDFTQHLFDSFSQEGVSVSRKHGGTGLGMNITKKLVDLMNGKIEVNSKKNKGTSIIVYLDLMIGQQSDLTEIETPEADVNLLRGKKILLTDDNETNRLLAMTILQTHGAEIIEAGNGREAIDILTQELPDLVLMDIQMPVMDGIEAIKQIRSKFGEGIPAIALTALALKGDNQKCLDAGFNGYLSKPFEESQLVSIVSKWLKSNKRRAGHVGTSGGKVLAGHTPLFNMLQLINIAKGNQQFVERMIDLFVKQTPISVNELKMAYLEGDIDQMKKVAHRMKPSLETMGIVSLKQVIADLEVADESGASPEELMEMIRILEETIREVVTELKKERDVAE